MLRFAALAALASATLLTLPQGALAQTASGMSGQPQAMQPQTKTRPEGTARQTAQAGFDPWHSKGHDLDNIADKLNSCELHPPQDMQACINEAVSKP
jgi:hypothetical protein